MNIIQNISAYICDDDLSFAANIKELIKKFNIGIWQTELFDNGSELLKAWRKKAADVVFLDIDMPVLDGFGVAERLGEFSDNVIIVFMTENEQDIFRIWKYKPFWLIRKSHLEDLPTAIFCINNEISNSRSHNENSCYLRGGSSMLEVPIDKLMYVESANHHVILKFRDGSERLIRCRMNDAEAQLKDHFVIRVQKGFLVNCKYISRLFSREVILHNGKSIPLGKTRAPEVKRIYQIYLQSHT